MRRSSSWGRWLGWLVSGRKSKKGCGSGCCHNKRGRRISIEPLEERQLLSISVCHWVGNGADAKWTNPLNWQVNGLSQAPVANDELVFDGANRKTTLNDFPAGTQFTSIELANSGFALDPYSDSSAHNITLTGGITVDPGVSGSGISLDVALGGPVTVDVAASESLILWGVLSGSNSLTKTDSGTLTLIGNNTYSGGTTIDDGYIYVGSWGPASTLGTGNVVNNAGLCFANSDVATIGNSISGSGWITKTGTGTIILTGTNTYTYGTTVYNGTLSVDCIADSGTSRLGDSGYLQISPMATLKYTGSGASTTGRRVLNDYPGGTIDVTQATGSLAFTTGYSTVEGVTKNGPGTLTIACPITDGAAIVVNDGILNLAGSNTYTGGTTVNAGMLVAATPAALPGYDSPGDVVVNGGAVGGRIGTGGWSETDFATLRANADWAASGAAMVIDTTIDDHVYSSSLVDPATANGDYTDASIGLIKLGPNTLTLDGTNTYTGGTTIGSGILRLGDGTTDGSVAGDIVDNAALVFNNASSQTYSGVISGSGSLTKTGTGKLVSRGKQHVHRRHDRRERQLFVLHRDAPD